MYLQMHIFALTINVSSNFRPKGRKGFALFNFLRNRLPKERSTVYKTFLYYTVARLEIQSACR
jgi:hypothetical protein